MAKQQYRCSFCRKSQDEVRRLICVSKSDVAICNECAVKVMEILEEEDAAERAKQSEPSQPVHDSEET